MFSEAGKRESREAGKHGSREVLMGEQKMKSFSQINADKNADLCKSSAFI